MYDNLKYITTPHTKQRPIKITAVLENRMREFLLARRQKMWREGR